VLAAGACTPAVCMSPPRPTAPRRSHAVCADASAAGLGSVTDAMKAAATMGGLPRLYVGLGAALAHVGAFHAVHSALFGAASRVVDTHAWLDSARNVRKVLLLLALANLAGSTLVTVAVYPIDTVRRRLLLSQVRLAAPMHLHAPPSCVLPAPLFDGALFRTPPRAHAPRPRQPPTAYACTPCTAAGRAAA
jgi:hypothetical protein